MLIKNNSTTRSYIIATTEIQPQAQKTISDEYYDDILTISDLQLIGSPPSDPYHVSRIPTALRVGADGSIRGLVGPNNTTVPLGGTALNNYARVSTLYNPVPRTAQNYTRTKAALLASTARVACIDNSTGMGAWAITGTALNGNRPYCLAQCVASALNSIGMPSQAHGFFGDNNVYAGSTATTLDAYDAPRIGLTSGWTASTTIFGPCAKALANSNVSTTPFSFTPQGVVDTFDIYTIGDTATGIISLTRTGDTTIPSFNTLTPSKQMKKVTFSGARGYNPLQIARVSGYTAIGAIDAYDSTVPANRFWNLGWSSGAIADFINTTDGTSCLNAILFMNPTTVTIKLAINDWRLGTSIGTYTAGMQTLINALLPTADVILLTDYPSANAAVPVLTQETYQNAIRTLAATNNLLLLDIAQKIGSQELQAAIGNYGDAQVHPNRNIYRDAGITVALALRELASN